MVLLSTVELLANDTILLKFSEDLAGDSTTDPDNYSIDNNMGVTKVLQDGNLDEVTLVVVGLQVGVLYLVTTSNLVGSSGMVVDPTSALEFTGRQTKLDKVLTSTPILYDTAPSSTFRHILTAIHRENDKIGGTE